MHFQIVTNTKEQRLSEWNDLSHLSKPMAFLEELRQFGVFLQEEEKKKRRHIYFYFKINK